MENSYAVADQHLAVGADVVPAHPGLAVIFQKDRLARALAGPSGHFPANILMEIEGEALHGVVAALQSCGDILGIFHRAPRQRGR